MFPILYSCNMLNISWSCGRDHFHLRNVNAEIFLIFVPSVLTLTAVCLVSVYVLKIQIKLKKEIPPTVNLPTISGALAQGTQAMAALNTEERNSLRPAGLEQRGSPGNNFDDIIIMDIEDHESYNQPEGRGNSVVLHEDMSRISIQLEAKEKKEKKQLSFDIRRTNSDPNTFFRVSNVRDLSLSLAPSHFPSSLLKPLSLIVERIMMLNMASLILVLIFILYNYMRLYFLLTGAPCEQTLLMTRTIKFVSFVLWIVYALLIRRKLCK